MTKILFYNKGQTNMSGFYTCEHDTFFSIVTEEDGNNHLMRDGKGRLFIFDREKEATETRNRYVELGAMLSTVKVMPIKIQGES